MPGETIKQAHMARAQTAAQPDLGAETRWVRSDMPGPGRGESGGQARSSASDEGTCETTSTSMSGLIRRATPIDLADVRELLRLDRGYHSSTDDGLLRETSRN
jgi:hypothetical protein